MTVRAARIADFPEIAAILAANDEPVDWPDLPDVGWPYLDHLTRRARILIAEEGGAVAGFAGSAMVGRDDVRMLTDLFVDPSRHGRGAGRALLAGAMDGAAERLTFSSADERALALYVRSGMRPWWPLLYLEIEAERLGAQAVGVEVVPADVGETARCSRDWTGVDRSVDFEHYASLPGAAGFLVRDGGDVAAVGWARRERGRHDGRWLNHASFSPDADPIRAALSVLRAAGAGGRLGAPVPGPHPVAAPLLEAGARIFDRDTFCATDPGLVDFLRVLPNPSFL